MLRAPTPTAAAELVAPPREVWLGALDLLARRLQTGALRQLDRAGSAPGCDGGSAGPAIGPGGAPAPAPGLAGAALAGPVAAGACSARGKICWPCSAVCQNGWQRDLAQRREATRAALRLGLLDPSLVLRRGYAWLSDAQGHTLSSVHQLAPGEAVRATLADGAVDLTVSGRSEQLVSTIQGFHNHPRGHHGTHPARSALRNRRLGPPLLQAKPWSFTTASTTTPMWST